MDSHLFVTTIIINSTIVLTSLLLIWKGVHKKPLSLFVIIFILMQLAAYIFNIDTLKTVIPHKDGGTSYQILTSSLIPLLFSFAVSFARKAIKNKTVDN